MPPGSFPLGIPIRGSRWATRHWVIRVQQNRALEGLEVGSPQQLFAALAAAPELGQLQFEVPAQKQRRKVQRSTV